MNWNDFLKHNPHFLKLLLIVIAVTFSILCVQSYIGVPYWDVFNYLNNALYFAGQGLVSDAVYLPPLIPIITAIFFKMGLVSEIVIFSLTAFMLVLGLMGLYILLRTRFNSVQSFAGSVIFLSLTVVMPWSASGGIDLPAVSISIWAVYFLVKGMNNSPKLLYLLFPTLALAFLTRYTAGLMLLPILLYFLLKSPKFDQWKAALISLFITIFASLPILYIFLQKIGNFGMFFTLFLSTFNGIADGASDVAFNPNYLYFLQNLPNYISISPIIGQYSVILNPSQGHPTLLAYILIIIGLIGLLVYVYQIFLAKIVEKKALNNIFVLKIILLVVVIAVFFFTFGQTLYVVSEALLFLACYLFYLSFRSESQEYLALDLMFFSWFVAYLIFHSILSFKVDRYFVTMAPALVYFLLVGLNGFFEKLNTKIRVPGLKSGKIYIIIALLLLVSTGVTYAGHVPNKCFVLNIRDAGDWIKSQDPDYQNKTFASDYPNALAWYLKKDVKGTFPRFYPTSGDFSLYLKQQNVEYYIDSLSNPKPTLDGYTPVKNFEMVTVYHKNSP